MTNDKRMARDCVLRYLADNKLPDATERRAVYEILDEVQSLRGTIGTIREHIDACIEFEGAISGDKLVRELYRVLTR